MDTNECGAVSLDGRCNPGMEFPAFGTPHPFGQIVRIFQAWSSFTRVLRP